MGLSSKEIFLVLRARDEASRTLNRVSRAMSKMDADAVGASQKVIQGNQGHLVELRRRITEVNTAYSDTISKAKTLFQTRSGEVTKGMVDLRRRIDDVQRAYQYTTLETQKLRMANKISAEEYAKRMYDARKLRSESLVSIQKERYALEDAQHAIQDEYHKTLQDARKLHLEQQKQLRGEINATQDEIALHKQRIAQIHERQAALKEHGHMLMQNGASAMYTGTAMFTMGVIGELAYKKMVDAAISYKQAAATTLTQIDDTGVKLKDIEKIGIEVGNKIPVAFEQLQPALYDIFSSINVGTKDAHKLLEQFAKDAVAGQTDMETATRANIAIMNAYKIKVKDASQVSDFMFRLVQKGVGTYSEFAKSIGKAIPSTVRAGQSYKMLGAMLAFMTRNGLNANMAATSAARAMDALSHPKTVEKLHQMGVKVKDLHGEFLPLPAILDQLNTKFGKLTAPERAKKLYELFQGSGGSIQAKRFFDMYFKNSEEFNKRVKEMGATAGIAEDKFNQMAKTPQAKFQELTNKMETLKITVGNDVLPVFLKFIGVISSLINWFQNLPEPIRKIIVISGLLISGLLVLFGALTSVSGGIVMMSGALEILGISAKTAAIKVGGLVGGLGIMVAGMYGAANSTTTTQKAISVFTSTAGAALAGFAVGGPIGAAIGGTIGLLGGLASASTAAKGSLKPLKINGDQLASTMNEVSGATTKATRALVAQEIVKSGIMKDINKQGLGISLRDMTKAVMGDKNAANEIAAKFIDAQNKIDARAAKMKPWALGAGSKGGGGGGQGILAEIGAEDKALKKIREQYKSMAGDVEKSQKDVREQWKATATARELLGKKLSNNKDLVFYVKKHGDDLPKTIEDVAKLQNAMKLPNKSLNLLMKVSGVKGSISDVKKMQLELKNAGKTKANMSDWSSSLNKGAKNGKKVIDDNIPGIKLSLKNGTKQKAEMGPFINSIDKGIRDGKKTSEKSRSIGIAMKFGLMAGISGIGSMLSGAIRGAVNAAIEAGKRAAKSNSPSKRTRDEIGIPLGQGIIVGIKSTKTSAVSATSNLVDSMIDALHKGIPLFTNATEILAVKANNVISSQYKKKGKKSALSQALTDAKDLQQQLKDQMKQYQQSVSENVKNYGSLSSLTNQTDVFGNAMPVTTSSVISGLQEKLSTIKQFGANLRKMKEMGYNPNIIDQVAQMGPEAGAEVAAALISAMPDDVSQINTLTTDIGSAAKDIGTFAADSMYGAGIATIDGLLAGLQSKDKKVREAAIAVAKEIIDTIKSELGIASPSKVGIALGANFGSSMAGAIASEESAIRNAARLLGNAAQEELIGQSQLMPLAINKGNVPLVNPQTNATTIQQEISITTQEIDPRVHAQQLGFELAERFRL